MESLDFLVSKNIAHYAGNFAQTNVKKKIDCRFYRNNPVYSEGLTME